MVVLVQHCCKRVLLHNVASSYEFAIPNVGRARLVPADLDRAGGHVSRGVLESAGLSTSRDAFQATRLRLNRIVPAHRGCAFLVPYLEEVRDREVPLGELGHG